MRFMKYVCLLTVVSALTASAVTITFKSGDRLNEWNNTGPNVLVTFNPVWGTDPDSGQWISYDDSGPGLTVLPDSSTVPFATFTEQFFLPGPNNTGTLNVWADDTAEVYLR